MCSSPKTSKRCGPMSSPGKEEDSARYQSTRCATPQLPLSCITENMIFMRPVSGTRQAKYMRCPSSVTETEDGRLQPGIVTASGVPEHVEPPEKQCMIPPGPFQ